MRAEIAAFPQASEEAFRWAVLELDPRLGESSPGNTAHTRELWRTCESQYAPHTGWSLDRLVSVRDLGWFDREAVRAPMPIHLYLYLYL